ncbi:MAG: hypothetical protein WHT63_12290, partial [Tepidiforma sp.]
WWGLALDGLAGLVAVHAGHHHVEEDELELLARDALERLLAAARAAEAPAEVLETLLAGTVGNAAARDYLTLLRRGAAWDLDRAFQRPDDARIPESPDALDGFLRAVIARFAASADEKAWQRSWQLLARAADAAGVDAVVPHAIALHEAGSDAFLVPAEARPLLEALRVS